MKKIILLCMVAFAVVACGKSEEEKQKEKLEKFFGQPISKGKAKEY
ncbi:hypothetical protein ACMY46_02695 [Bartonella bacilliformis]|nr:hypothetical protein [Bartonella bacilliformis]KEG16392.1 hypothetical protein H705_00257 [Bartonella bacilliformis Cond044]